MNILKAITAIGLSAAVGLAQAAGDPTGSISISNPTDGSVYTVESFPTTIDVTFGFDFRGSNGNCLNNAVNTLQLKSVDSLGGEILFYDANPNLGNDCPTELIVPMTVNAPGLYSIEAYAKRAQVEATDEVINLEFKLSTVVSIEYPAPPAIANKFINADPVLKAASGKKRGCIISKVAEQHAKYETYGPKGGPYDNVKVESDTMSFAGGCK